MQAEICIILKNYWKMQKKKKQATKIFCNEKNAEIHAAAQKSPKLNKEV